MWSVLEISFQGQKIYGLNGATMGAAPLTRLAWPLVDLTIFHMLNHIYWPLTRELWPLPQPVRLSCSFKSLADSSSSRFTSTNLSHFLCQSHTSHGNGWSAACRHEQEESDEQRGLDLWVSCMRLIGCFTRNDIDNWINLFAFYNDFHTYICASLEHKKQNNVVVFFSPRPCKCNRRGNCSWRAVCCFLIKK